MRGSTGPAQRPARAVDLPQEFVEFVAVGGVAQEAEGVEPALARLAKRLAGELDPLVRHKISPEVVATSLGTAGHKDSVHPQLEHLHQE